MRALQFRLAGSLALALACTAAYGQGFAWEQLTPDDVVQTVRTFESEPSLALSAPELLVGGGNGDPTMFAETLLYSTTSGSYAYSVSGYMHTRLTRQDLSFGDKAAFYGQPYDPNVLAQQMMTQDAAIAIAQAFMQAHYPNPQLLNQWVVGAEKEIDSGRHLTAFAPIYTVTFTQGLGNGVNGPCSCMVDVDSVRGKVISYYQGYYPVYTSTTPALTADQAMAAAMNAVLGAPGVPVDARPPYVTHPDEFGAQTLAYHVEFQPATDDGLPTTYVVDVDAFTGNVIHTSMLQSLSRPKQPRALAADHIRAIWRSAVHGAPPTSLAARIGQLPAALLEPPIIVSTRPYLSAGYLCYGAKGAKLWYRGPDNIEVNGPTRHLRFSTASATYTVNGATKRLPAKPVILNGRCYVPLEAFKGVLPFDIRYDGKANVVHFDPLKRARQAKRAQK